MLRESPGTTRVALLLAPAMVAELGWPPIDHVGVEGRLKGHEKTGNLPSFAIVGVVVCSVVIPVMGVYRVALNAASTAQVLSAVIATAVLLPPQVLLVLAASRGRASTGHRWALAAMAAVIVAALPIVGVTWLGAVFPLSALVLVVMPRPFGFITFGALVLVPIPIAYALGAPEWAQYFLVGTLMYGLGVAVPVWLIAAAGELKRARSALADDAVLLERVRIDQELGLIVGPALATIAERGEVASGRALPDPAGSTALLQELVDHSRGTLAEVRRLVRGYRAVPLSAELRSALGLLEAAGIATKLVLPRDELPATLGDEQRKALRARLAALLGDDGLRTCVCTVTVHNGVARVDVSARERTLALLDVEAA